MIDNFAILLSTALTAYVTWRAVRLTLGKPWFEAVPEDEMQAARSRRGGPRRDLRAELEAAARQKAAAGPAGRARGRA